MPGYTGVHVNRPLTNVSLYYSNPGYVAEDVAPSVKVTKESDLYFIYGKEHFRVPQTFRADRSRTREVDYSLSTDAYVCREYGLHQIVTDRERDNTDEPLSPDRDAVNNITEILLLDREIRTANAVLSSANFGSYSTTHVQSLALAWDNLGTANPRTDIYMAKFLVWKDSRRQANHMFIPVEVAYQMAQMDAIDELRKYTDPNLVTDSGLPPKVWGLTVKECQATYDSSAEGDTEDFNEVWGANILITHKNPGTIGIKTLTFAITFMSQAFQTRKWRDQGIKGDTVEVDHRYDVKVIAPACGFVYTNVLTSVA